MSDNKNKTIYDLKLHERIDIKKGNIEVIRVAGGRNYIYYRIDKVWDRSYIKNIFNVCFYFL